MLICQGKKTHKYLKSFLLASCRSCPASLEASLTRAVLDEAKSTYLSGSTFAVSMPNDDPTNDDTTDDAVDTVMKDVDTATDELERMRAKMLKDVGIEGVESK